MRLNPVGIDYLLGSGTRRAPARPQENVTTTENRIDEAALRPRQAVLWAIGVAWYLVAAWLLVQRGLVGWLSDNPSVNFYLAQPVIWLGLAGFSYSGWRRLPDRPPLSRTLTSIAALLAMLHAGFLVFGGLIFGFGDSYVAGQIANYPRNLWFIGTWLIGLEVARAFIFHAWRPFSERWAFAGTAALLALAMTPYGQLRALTDGETFFNLVGGFIIPTVVLSILLTWLAGHGGPGPAMGYGFVLLAFEWFSQVQPDLDWPVRFLVGVAAPIVSARFIRNIYLDTKEGQARWADVDHNADDPGEYRPRRQTPWSLGITAGPDRTADPRRGDGLPTRRRDRDVHGARLRTRGHGHHQP